MEKARTLRTSLIAGALMAALAAVPARGHDDDHDLARKLVAEGRILALADVVARVKAEVPGEMLEVEFEAEHGAYVYEFKLLRPDGRVQEVEADAVTGKILKIGDDD